MPHSNKWLFIINFFDKHIGKWYLIAMGLILLVGITGWFSGGKNGNLIFTSSITIIGIMFAIGFFIIKLPEIRYGKMKVLELRKEEREREYQLIKNESDIWDLLTKIQRKDLCKRLGLSTRHAKRSLIDIPIKERKMLVYIINIEFAKKDEKDRRGNWDSSSGQPTYYEMLGIDRNASENEIKNAFRKKILAWHPDKRKDIEDAGEYTKILNEIKGTLLDKEKRKQYDSTLN